MRRKAAGERCEFPLYVCRQLGIKCKTGDKSTFAIECKIRDAIDSFVYCNFRFWIAGEPIGDWDEAAVLGVLMHSADVYMRYQGNRCLDIANNMNTEQLWNHIDRVVNSDAPDDLYLSLGGPLSPKLLVA